MNLQGEPPEKKKKRTKKTNDSSPSSSSPSFSLLPDEITVNCLARISRSYYPILSVVSKSFRSLVSSTELYTARYHLGNTEQCVYVCLQERYGQFPQLFTLWINPNRTLPDSMIKKRKKTIGQLLVPITSPDIPLKSFTNIAVGSEIYVIGQPNNYAPSSAVRVLDCCSHTWRDAPSMNVARKYASACVYDGKIYVIGGCVEVEDSWAEVFDTKTQTWECLPDPGTEEIRKYYTVRVAEMGGKIYFENSRETYAYDPKQGKSECCKGRIAFPISKCVMDSVSYRHNLRSMDRFKLMWSNDRHWRVVKGLDSLGEMYKRNSSSSSKYTTNLVSCGGKLLLIWEGYMTNPKDMKKIWCAEIVIEKRDGGEVWGKVEWVDVVRKVPSSCQLFNCLVVSV